MGRGNGSGTIEAFEKRVDADDRHLECLRVGIDRRQNGAVGPLLLGLLLYTAGDRYGIAGYKGCRFIPAIDDRHCKCMPLDANRRRKKMYERIKEHNGDTETS